jgi:hypothetical protein
LGYSWLLFILKQLWALPFSREIDWNNPAISFKLSGFLILAVDSAKTPPFPFWPEVIFRLFSTLEGVKSHQ